MKDRIAAIGTLADVAAMLAQQLDSLTEELAERLESLHREASDYEFDDEDDDLPPPLA